MNEARYLALKCEQMVWTRHTDAVFGKCPVDDDEIVKVTWTSPGLTTPPIKAGDCNWGHKIDGKPDPVLHYETCEPRFPELCKETEAKAKGSQVIGEFLEWLTENNIGLATSYSDDELIARFFGIDTKKAEAERQQLLDEFVKSQQGAAQ